MRDELGSLYRDADFRDLFPCVGQPALAPWRLALVCVMQFAEGLSDRQAAQAVRARIGWKYALAMELDDPGFDFSVLSEFRARLLAGGAEQRLLEVMLTRFREHGWLKARGRQRTDSTRVLAAVRAVNRLESVVETMRAALNTVASVAPEWLRALAPPEWFERYTHRAEDFWLPQGKQVRADYAARVGADGFALLAAAAGDGTAPPEVRDLPALKVLRAMWTHQYEVPQPGEPARWLAAVDLPPASTRFDSPYDPEAHFGNKHPQSWLGYKVHFTETCGETEAHLITHVETTSATLPDIVMTGVVHQALSAKGLLPSEHLVDAGYVSADHLVSSPRNHGVDLIGPRRDNVAWRARAASGYDFSNFAIDWGAKRAVCPQGKQSRTWSETKGPTGQPLINVRFANRDCGICPQRDLCTHTKVGYVRRELTLRPRAQHEALQHQRARQLTPEWQELYHRRAGVEGTFSQGVRVHGLRRSRYRGRAKTHLQLLATAAAINLGRLDAWLRQRPTASTRRSRFAALRG